MLKFLTHKLRTHSINEDNYIEKVNFTHFIKFSLVEGHTKYGGYISTLRTKKLMFQAHFYPFRII